MRVKMKSVYCTPTAYCDPGKGIDLGNDEAKQLIDGGFASAIKPGETIRNGKEPRNVKSSSNDD